MTSKSSIFSLQAGIGSALSALLFLCPPSSPMPALAADAPESGAVQDAEAAASAVPPAGVAASPTWSALDENGAPVDGTTRLYDGGLAAPIASITDGKTTLSDGNGYIVRYYNNAKAPDTVSSDGKTADSSTAAATISGTGEYASSIGFAVTYKIRKMNLSNPEDVTIVLGGDAGKSWPVGARPEPTITRTVDGKQVQYGTDDLSIEYSGNDRLGSSDAKAVLRALPGSMFVGTVEIPFKIVANRADPALEVSDIADQQYTGKAIAPPLEVKYVPGDGTASTKLAEGEYTAEYSDNIAVGTGRVSVSGIGKYQGMSASKTFRIVDGAAPGANGGRDDSEARQETPGQTGGDVAAKDIKDAGAPKIADKTYTGSALTVSAAGLGLTYAGKKLVAGTDYEEKLDYKNNVHAGTATVTVTGKGEYSGKKQLTFRIAPAPLSKIHIPPIKGQAYSKKNRKPAVEATFGKVKLSEGRDYTVKYSNYKSAGTATATVTGKGDYAGTRKIEYKLLDKAKLSLDKTVMMIDNCHYNKCKLTATIEDNCGYKSKDIKWKVKFDESFPNAVSFEREKQVSKKTGGKTVSIFGRRWSGNNPIKVTATLPNGSKATCKLRVIVSASDEVPGDVFYSDHGSYVRPLDSKLNREGWGDEYVEAYVNNADWLIKTYPEAKRFDSEASAKTIHGYVQNTLKIKSNAKKRLITSASGPKINYRNSGSVGSAEEYDVFTHKEMKKEKGELSPNNYVFLFTHKNQWAYMLKKNKKGVWHVTSSLRTSAGYEKNRFEQYGTIMAHESANGGGGLWLSRGSGNDKGSSFSLYTNSNHISGQNRIGSEGRPVTAGCILMGRYNTSHVFYDLFVKAGICTRMINF